MDADSALTERGSGGVSGLRKAVWGIGWAVALAGALSIFNVPMYLNALLLIAGGVICLVAVPGAPRINWRSWLVMVSGWVLIIGVLNLFGEERVRHWIPHPAGYGCAWFVCFVGFRQVWWWLHRGEASQGSKV